MEDHEKETKEKKSSKRICIEERYWKKRKKRKFRPQNRNPDFCSYLRGNTETTFSKRPKATVAQPSPISTIFDTERIPNMKNPGSLLKARLHLSSKTLVCASSQVDYFLPTWASGRNMKSLSFMIVIKQILVCYWETDTRNLIYVTSAIIDGTI